MKEAIPLPNNGDLRTWANAIVAYLRRKETEAVQPAPVLLASLTANASAKQPGVLMYDRAANAIVVSDGTTWKTVAVLP